MTRRLWLLIAVCIAAPLALAQQISRPGQSASANADAEKRSSEPSSALPASAALSITDSLQRIAAAQETQAKGGDSADEKQDKKADLQAQKDMAFWAKLMFFASVGSLVFTIAATGLLVFTFKQTRRATYAARQSAVSARQAVRDSRKSAEKQLRAYVDVFHVSATWLAEPDDVTMKKVRVQAQFKNTGQTPAHEVIAWMRVENLPPDSPVFDLDAPELVATGVQGPGAINHLEELKQFDSGTGIVAGWKDGRRSLFVYGTIKYTDAFDEPRESHFRFFMPSEGVDSDEIKGHDGIKYRVGKFQAYKGGYST